MGGFLDKTGLTTPQVTTEEIILRGKPISDLLANETNIRITASHALGDFYFSITPHMPEGVLPLNGSEVSRTTYSDLYNYVLTIHNELVASGKKFIVSEEEWQNISIENNGYVPYYSYGTGEDLFRLPRMSGYLKARGELDDAGNYVAEGLPNITANSKWQGVSHSGEANGAFIRNVQLNVGETYGGYGTSNVVSFDLDASRSNTIYGNSEHVTPETNTLFVGVWALTAFTQVGTANLEEIKEIIKNCESILGDSLPLLSSRYDNKGLETSSWKLSDGSWLDGRIYTDAYNKILQRITEGDSTCLEMKESELLSSNEFPENFLIDTDGVKFRLPLFVVNERTIIKQWQEGTEWYRIYSGGYCEQGGLRTASTSEGTGWIPLSFHLPFNNTDYNILLQAIEPDDNLNLNTASLRNKTNTSVLIANAFNNTGYSNYGTYWRAEGYTEIPPREEWEIDFSYYFKVSHGVDEGRINIEEKLTEFEETAYTRLNEVVEEVSKDYVVHVDKQVGELYFSFDNYCPDGVIPLDGRLVSRATYADLWQWVQEKGLVKDDVIITTNDENTVSIFNEDGSIRYCQWYGSGDGQLTFRVPKINGYLGATGDNSLAGQYVAEGLPNITGTSKYFMTRDERSSSGAIIDIPTVQLGYGGGGAYPYSYVDFDASRSNTIYGNSEHVTPETNTLFVGVWAITATKAAVFDMRDIEEAIKSSESYLMNNVPLMSSRWDRDGLGNLGWVKADGSWVDGRTYTGAYNYCVEKLVNGHEDFIDGQVATITTDNCSKFIVDRINKRFRLPISNGQRQLVASYKNGTQWYKIYSDGYTEQGGLTDTLPSNTNTIVNLYRPLLDINYQITSSERYDNGTSDGNNENYWISKVDKAYFQIYNSASGLKSVYWEVKGYGEILSVSSPLRTSHLYFKLAHEFYVPAQAEIQEKLDLIDNLVAKTDINLPTLSSRWDSDFAENVGWVKSEGQWLNGNTYRDAYDLMVSRIGINDKFVAATVGTELTDENADKFLIDTTAVKFRLPLINGERVLVAKGNTNKKTYELYSDGYLIQSGVFDVASNNYVSGTITLDRSYKDLYYSIDLRSNANGTNYVGVYNTKTVNSFKYAYVITTEGCASWETKGLSAIPTPSEYNCGNYLFFKLADEVPSTVVNTQQIIDDLKTECDQFRQTLETLMSQGHFVIETYMSEDGNSWYRKYSDGWIEQGGPLHKSSNAGNGRTTVSFQVPFSNNDYTLVSRVAKNSSDYSASYRNPYSKTTTGFTYYADSIDHDGSWYACGY